MRTYVMCRGDGSHLHGERRKNINILVFTLCAAVFLLLGAFLSGGLILPKRAKRGAPAREDTPVDDFGRDLAALLGYGAGEKEVVDETE